MAVALPPVAARQGRPSGTARAALRSKGIRTMAFTERHIDSVVILDLNGQLTELSGNDMWERIRDLAAAGDRQILLNLAEVPYVDSAGLGTMVASFVAMKCVGGALKLLNPTRRTRQLLAVTALTTVLQPFDSEALALASFAAAAE
jgi:anti-sigma B factor antagonist